MSSMSGKRTIVYTSIAIITAFLIGSLTSEPLVDAIKPLTEVIVVNDATKPIPVTGSISSNPVCPAENVRHYDKIVFDLIPLNGTEPISVSGTIFGEFGDPPVKLGKLVIPRLDIKVLDDPNEIADLIDKVVNFVDTHPLPPLAQQIVDDLIADPTVDFTGFDVFIIDVEYAIVCATP